MVFAAVNVIRLIIIARCDTKKKARSSSGFSVCFSLLFFSGIMYMLCHPGSINAWDKLLFRLKAVHFLHR